MLLALLMSVAVQGVVVAQDGSPLPGVTVTLAQGAARTTVVTDAKGKFSFPDAADAPYRVIAELNGFAPAEAKGSGSAPLKIPMTAPLDFSSVFG